MFSGSITKYSCFVGALSTQKMELHGLECTFLVQSCSSKNEFGCNWNSFCYCMLVLNRRWNSGSIHAMLDEHWKYSYRPSYHI